MRTRRKNRIIPAVVLTCALGLLSVCLMKINVKADADCLVTVEAIDECGRPVEGVVITGAGEYDYKSEVTVSLQDAEVDGYHFIGWYNGDYGFPNCLEDHYFLTTDLSYSFTAEWSKSDYKAVFGIGNTESVTYRDENGTDITADARSISLDSISGDVYFVDPGLYFLSGSGTLGSVHFMHGETSVVLADGCEFGCTRLEAIQNFSIYGQAEGTGKLICNSGDSYDGIFLEGDSDNCGRFSLNGGNVEINVSGEPFCGLYGLYEDIIINRGSLKISGSVKDCGIAGRTVTVNGGIVDVSVSALGTNTFGIRSDGDIILGYTSEESDSFFSSLGFLADSVMVKTGQKLRLDNTFTEISGTLSEEERESIVNVTLRPCVDTVQMYMQASVGTKINTKFLFTTEGFSDPHAFVNGEEKTLSTETVDSVSYYVFTMEGSAIEMADLNELKITDGEEIKAKRNISIQAYLESIITHPDTSLYKKPIRVAACRMLQYGAAAQKYFNHNTEHPANAGIIDLPSDESGAYWPKSQYDFSLDYYNNDARCKISEDTTKPYFTKEEMDKAVNIEGLSYYGTNMTFSSDVSLLLAYEITDSERSEAVKAELESKLGSNATCSFDNSGKFLIVKFAGVPIKQFDNPAVTFSSDEKTVTVYPYHYLLKIERKYDNDSDLKKMCRGLNIFYNSIRSVNAT